MQIFISIEEGLEPASHRWESLDEGSTITITVSLPIRVNITTNAQTPQITVDMSIIGSNPLYTRDFSIDMNSASH